MKITKKQLRQIIKEELEEAAGGRIGAPYSGVTTDDVAEPAASQPVATVKELWHALKAGDESITLGMDSVERSLLGSALAKFMDS